MREGSGYIKDDWPLVLIWGVVFAVVSGVLWLVFVFWGISMKAIIGLSIFGGIAVAGVIGLIQTWWIPRGRGRRRGPGDSE